MLMSNVNSNTSIHDNMNTTNNDKNKNTNSLTQLLFERNSQQFKVNYNLIRQSNIP